MIEDDYDMDASQENDETNIPTAGEEPIDRAEGYEDIGGEEEHGNEEHRGNVIDWTFQYR